MAGKYKVLQKNIDRKGWTTLGVGFQSENSDKINIYIHQLGSPDLHLLIAPQEEQERQETRAPYKKPEWDDSTGQFGPDSFER